MFTCCLSSFQLLTHSLPPAELMMTLIFVATFICDTCHLLSVSPRVSFKRLSLFFQGELSERGAFLQAPAVSWLDRNPSVGGLKLSFLPNLLYSLLPWTSFQIKKKKKKEKLHHFPACFSRHWSSVQIWGMQIIPTGSNWLVVFSIQLQTSEQ